MGGRSRSACLRPSRKRRRRTNLRWTRVTSGKDAEGFKINNVFTALLARKAMREHEALEDFFETRARRGEAS